MAGEDGRLLEAVGKSRRCKGHEEEELHVVFSLILLGFKVDIRNVLKVCVWIAERNWDGE